MSVPSSDPGTFEASIGASRPRPKPGGYQISCQLCHQRKIRCDRVSPSCGACRKASVRCVPADMLPVRARRRRFAEKELLGRVRQYEQLLKEHGIKFEPLHPKVDDPDGVKPTLQKVEDTNADSGTVDLWHAISRATLQTSGHDDAESERDEMSDYGSPEDESQVKQERQRNAVFESIWRGRFRHEDYAYASASGGKCLLFAEPVEGIALGSLNPNPTQAFKLWQSYLDNVNPLLKVTHIPSLQPRVLEAIGDLEKVEPSLHALLLSIYCIATRSLDLVECRTIFQAEREQLLLGYHAACRQALLTCNAWWASNMDSLTAMYFYLLAIASDTDPRPLSSMTTVLIRLAQRMGLHTESSNCRFSVLEAQIRRRLWWAIVTFEHRVCGLAEDRVTSLSGDWNCQTPLNVNDFELRADMKVAPVVRDDPTEALFAVVRSEMTNYYRHDTVQNIVTKSGSRSLAAESRVRMALATGRAVEEKYLSRCNEHDPLHIMAVWTTRGMVARHCLLEQYMAQMSVSASASTAQTETDRADALSSAITMLECDTFLRSSPLTRRFLWFTELYFPALAYMHLLMSLTKSPGHPIAEQAWRAMSDNYASLGLGSGYESGTDVGAMYGSPGHNAGNFLFVSFAKVVLLAWEAREAWVRREGRMAEEAPALIADVRSASMATAESATTRGRGGGGMQGASAGVPATAFRMGWGSGPTYERPAAQFRADQIPNATPNMHFTHGMIAEPLFGVDAIEPFLDVDWKWMDLAGTQLP